MKRWLKKATTIPSKGPLSGLRKVFGENMMDEIGTVGGFLLGGPGGAAVGRGLGNAIHTQDAGKALRAGAEGYAMGAGANALGLGGGGGLSLPKMGGGQVADAVRSGVTRGGGAGRVVSGAAGWLKDNPELALAGLSAVGGMRQQGRAAGLQDEALAMARADQASRGRFADLALKRLEAMDLSGSAGRSRAPSLVDTGNPY